MAQAPIIPITPIDTGLQWLTERDSVVQASANAFQAGNFVSISGTGGSNTLVSFPNATSYASATLTLYGLAQKSALASTAEPYQTPTGTTATPISPINTEFWISTLTTAGAVGTGDASALVTGSTYGLFAFTTAGYSGQQGVVAATVAGNNTGAVIFTGKLYPGYAATDSNCPASFVVAPSIITP